jgi:hypothetical protein
VSSADLPSS